MTTAVDHNDQHLLELLHKQGPMTVRDLCDAMDVTANAVRQRLGRLQAGGYITRQAIREGRGRPHHTYELTEQALRELGDNYRDLALILWQTISEVEDETVRTSLYRKVQEILVKRYQSGSVTSSLNDRLDHLKGKMLESGFDVELDTTGELPILRENHCPYHELASTDPSICELEQAVFEEVLGTSVTLTQCCLEGHHCCEFEANTVSTT